MAANIVEELGFADFVAVLLVETLDSIVASHTSQAERLRALDEAAQLDAAEFASSIGDQPVSDAMARLFPPADPIEATTSVVVGGPVPAKSELAELDIELGGRDQRGGKLTKAGVMTIATGVRQYLAIQQLSAVRETAQRGVPRVRVDGGVLRAKLDLTAVHVNDPPAGNAGGSASGSSNTPSRSAIPARSIGSIARGPALGAAINLRPQLLPGVLESIRTTRLSVVQPTDDSNEQSATATMSGEVEIHFSTEL